jgi:hypothetical protein
VFVTAFCDLQPFHSESVHFLSLPINIRFDFDFYYLSEVKKSIVIHIDNILSPLDNLIKVYNPEGSNISAWFIFAFVVHVQNLLPFMTI